MCANRYTQEFKVEAGEQITERSYAVGSDKPIC